MANELKAGDVVKLKSGSLPMTISSISDGWVFCVFFNNDGSFQKIDMSLDTVVKI